MGERASGAEADDRLAGHHAHRQGTAAVLDKRQIADHGPGHRHFGQPLNHPLERIGKAGFTGQLKPLFNGPVTDRKSTRLHSSR